MHINKKINAYTLLELIIVMALSTIIVSLIFMALFLIQKQIQSNKESYIYDQSLLMSVIDHHLFECQHVYIEKQTIHFEYPQKKQTIKFSENVTILNNSDTLPIQAQIIDSKSDPITRLVNSFQLRIKIGNDQLIIYKESNLSNSNILNNKQIDFSY